MSVYTQRRFCAFVVLGGVAAEVPGKTTSRRANAESITSFANSDNSSTPSIVHHELDLLRTQNLVFQ